MRRTPSRAPVCAGVAMQIRAPRRKTALLLAVGAVAVGVGVAAYATHVEAGGRTQLLGREGLLREIGARAAEVRVVQDPDGVVRRFAYTYRGLHSFAVAAVEAATAHAVGRSRFSADGTAPVDFDGPPETVKFVSFMDVLRGSVPREALRGKI